MVAWSTNAIKAVTTQGRRSVCLDHEFQKCKQHPKAVRQGFITHKSLASQVSLEPVPLLEEKLVLTLP